jgi:hypothetical protein
MTTVLPGTTRYLCPLRCRWHHDVPPPSAMDATGIVIPEGVTDVREAIGHLAGEATLRTAATTEAALVAHLGTHTTLQFVTVIADLRAQIEALTHPATPPGGEASGG